MRNNLIFIIIFELLALGQMAFAGSIFDITITDYGGFAGVGEAAVDAAVLELENEVRANLPDANQGEFFEAMANASVMAGKDLHSDPINPVDYAMVILGVGGGIDLNDRTFDDIEDED